jgi:hypothetical protein
MSLAGNAIYHILSNNSTISAAITQDGRYKIHPLTAYVQEDIPFITYQQITKQANRTKGADNGPDIITMQINIIHYNYESAHTLADAVRDALDLQSGIINGTNIQYLAYQSEREQWMDEGELQGIAMIMQEYLIRVVRS